MCYFYKTPDRFIPDIAPTLIAVTVLLFLFSFLICPDLLKFDRTIERVANGEQISDEERKAALKVYSKEVIYVIIANVIGFVVGQVVCMTLDFKNGVVPYTFERAILIVFQAALIGFVLALYETYLLNTMMMNPRKLLNITSLEEFGEGKEEQKRLTVTRKLILVFIATLCLMGVNMLSAPFYLALDTGLSDTINNLHTETVKVTEVANDLEQTVVTAANANAAMKVSVEKIQNETNNQIKLIEEANQKAKELNEIAQNIDSVAVMTKQADELSTSLETVAADEVRKLASSSSKSADDIKMQIVNIMEKINIGVNSINDADKAFKSINNDINKTSELMKTINDIMDKQRIEAHSTLSSTNSVVEAINIIQDLTRRQNASSETMQAIIKDIVESSQNVSNAITENTDNSSNMNIAITNVSHSSEDNKKAVS